MPLFLQISNQITQLFTNYGTSMLMNVERRKSYLQKDYYFTCDCQPCSENWPLLDQIDWTYLSVNNNIFKVILCLKFNLFNTIKTFLPANKF